MILPPRVDAVILGAGFVALALARELAARGHDVAVFSAGPSRAGRPSGLVNAQARRTTDPEALNEIALFSRHLFAGFVEELEEVAGFSCDFDVHGAIALARTGDEEVALDRALDWQRARGLSFELLSADETHAREPLAEAQAAALFPDEGTVDPGRLRAGLLAAARDEGVRVFAETPVLELLTEAGRASGVRTLAGPLHAPFVVNAFGASAALSGLAGAPALPLRLHRSLRIELAAPQGLPRTVLARGMKLVPRRDGTVTLLGDPSEVRDASLRPGAGEVARLLDAASAALPSLARWPLAIPDALSARLHLGAPDDLPLLGETETAGYFLATAFRDDTVLLAPAASLLLADLVTRQAPAIAMNPFSPARFNL